MAQHGVSYTKAQRAEFARRDAARRAERFANMTIEQALAEMPNVMHPEPDGGFGFYSLSGDGTIEVLYGVEAAERYLLINRK